VTPHTYVDADGAGHEVLVRDTPVGDWQVLDTCAAETRVVETLDGREDGRPQAEALARDYVQTISQTAGRHTAERIPEQGGADAHSDRRPRPAARQPHARGAALSRQAG
jgi:hypothetical protein